MAAFRFVHFHLTLASAAPDVNSATGNSNFTARVYLCRIKGEYISGIRPMAQTKNGGATRKQQIRGWNGQKVAPVTYGVQARNVVLKVRRGFCFSGSSRFEGLFALVLSPAFKPC